jgi:hypothetical protein
MVAGGGLGWALGRRQRTTAWAWPLSLLCGPVVAVRALEAETSGLTSAECGMLVVAMGFFALFVVLPVTVIATQCTAFAFGLLGRGGIDLARLKPDKGGLIHLDLTR